MKQDYTSHYTSSDAATAEGLGSAAGAHGNHCPTNHRRTNYRRNNNRHTNFRRTYCRRVYPSSQDRQKE